MIWVPRYLYCTPPRQLHVYRPIFVCLPYCVHSGPWWLFVLLSLRDTNEKGQASAYTLMNSLLLFLIVTIQHSKLGSFTIVKAVFCYPAYLTYMQSTLCKMPGWMKHKLESRFAGRNINNLTNADDTTLMAESEEELKNLLIKVQEESEKAGLKLSTQKMKIMASSLITSW